ncbi:retrovirus-related pol polyprotein from transposon TNT 1-94 [Tanacetum coccineum]|uniref:Retrovirus-related pol polyprotein from transposon TNT 1-94 n=1 Tax=Tanacetum coccineum TaxID=301880 RepID=A0ABQ5FXS5_9ASTR
MAEGADKPDSQNEQKFQKDYKAKYKKVNTKLALLEASPSTSQYPKPFQTKNKGLVVETFDWDEKEISDNKEMIQVKVLMALADDELSVGKNHARNGECIDITMKKRHIREPIWFLDSGCSRSMTGVKIYLHNYVQQPGPRIVFGDNSSCIAEGYGSINYGVSQNFSSPYTPEENGIAKRKNKTLIEAARTIMNGSGKKKSHSVSQPKPKTQGHEASGALPQKRKKCKSKKTSLQTPATLPSEKVPTEDSGKT